MVVGVLVLSTTPAWAAQYFVSPQGQATNDGTIDRPLDLATALSAASPVAPGDTVWLRGGVYSGVYTSVLRGTAAMPIIVKQYADERSTLDGAGSPQDVLTVYGEWVQFWDFEITNSNLQRITNQSGPWPTDLGRGGGITARGPNLKFINLILRNLLTGISVWTESINTEVHGCLIYHNGWQGADGSHGHGIYTQNDEPTRLLSENILFNQFSHGIHAYASSIATVNNVTLEGNVAFNNGIIGSSGFERDLLIGGGAVVHNPIMRENYTYGGAHSLIGFATGCTGGLVTGNYFVGRDPFVLDNCAPPTTGNVFYGSLAAVDGYGALAESFPANTFLYARPTTDVVTVRPNSYQPGRGHVIVYNWTGRGLVTVDLAPLELTNGTYYQVRDAQNFFGPPVIAGYYTGTPVQVPMYGLTAEPPVGNVPVVPPHTAPEFGVFVVLPGISGPVVNPPSQVQAPTISPSGGAHTGPLSVAITAAAGTQIRYTLNGQPPTLASTLYTGPFAVTTSTTVRARAFASGVMDSDISTAALVVDGGASAVFVGHDGITQGNWRGVYGRDGAVIVGDSSSIPAYAQIAVPTQAPLIWANPTPDTRGLQRRVGPERIAAAWHDDTFDFDLNFVDAQSHQVAVYAINWDDNERGQRVDVLDTVTGALLDTRSVDDFTGGRYLVWQLRGRVTLRVTRTVPAGFGREAVLSGLFIDPIAANNAPRVALSGPPTGSVFPAPASITVSAGTIDFDGTVSQVEFFANGAPIGSDTTVPFNVNWLNVPVGIYELTAAATDNSGALTTSSPITITVSADGAGIGQPLTVRGIRNFSNPVHVTGAGDGSGRLFVVELGGRIWIVRGNTVLSTPFLDVTSKLDCGDGRRRLLSIAFPPGYAIKQHFYVKYLDRSCNITISRFSTSADPDVGDLSSEEIVVSQPVGDGLFGGPLYFGPDGYLYASLGDGSHSDSDPGNPAQDMGTILGKMLRIDVETGNPPTYTIPPTNPFVNTPGVRPEIWASGFRNPWRFSFDRQTGDLYIGDVGSQSYEEINFQPGNSVGGQNYGWKTLEGNHCFGAPSCNTDGLTPPIVEYRHSVGCSVTGGVVYRGQAIPALRGTYIFGDLCSGYIWGVRRVGQTWQTSLLATTEHGSGAYHSAALSIVAFGEDDDGNVYLLDYAHEHDGGAGDPGGLYLIEQNFSTAPVAAFLSNPSTIAQGQASELSWMTTNAASVVIEPGIGVVPVNGTMNVTPIVTTTYTLTVQGLHGDVTTKTATVTVTPVNQAPTVSIAASAPNGWIAPATVMLTATAADSDGTVARVEFYAGSNRLGEDTSPPYSFTWANVGAGSYSVTARAVDNAGAATTATPVSVTINANQLPTVSVAASAPGGWVAPATVVLDATAGDSDGTVARVEFYQETTRLGEDTTAPYTWIWSGVAAGSYNVTARAFDNYGATTSSMPVAVTVSFNQPPTISSVTLAAPGGLIAPATIVLDATAADNDGTVARVEFFAGTTRLGEDTLAPFSWTWTNVAAGSYSVTARAIDNVGATTTSTPPVSVTVLPGSSTAAAAVLNGLAFMTSAAAPTLNLSGPMTVEAWIKTTSTAQQGIVERFNAYGVGSVNGGYGLRLEGGRLKFFTARNAAELTGTAVGATPVTLGVWHHVAGIYDGSQVRVYLDGVLDGAAPATAGPGWGVAETKIGTRGDSVGATRFIGVIDDVRLSTAVIYSGAFTPEPRLGVLPSTRALWSFDARDGVDASSYRHHLQALSAVTFTSDVPGGAPPPNLPPTVSLTAAAPGGWSAPATVVLDATAGDSDGTVARVEFYQGTTRLGEDTLAPFSWTWSGVAAGSYSVTARATDNSGAITTSTPVSVTVTSAPGNQPPTVSVAASAPAGWLAPATVMLDATAGDSDGTVARVEFYQGTTRLGEDTLAPFSWTWSGVAAGTYSVTARATDNSGATTTSTPVSITVTAITPPATPARIMPLGDSLTYGIGHESHQHGGYRIDLLSRLTAAGVPVDFLGTQQSGPGSMADRDNEGHNGWDIVEISGSVNSWLATYAPETILLLIGTNDINEFATGATTATRLNALIGQIYGQRPNATLIVGSILPIADSAKNNQVLAYNALIPGIVSSFAAGGRNIHYVDMHSAVPLTDLVDGVHPGTAGYSKMATVWFNKLIEILAAP